MFWEEKFTGEENLFSAVNMKNCCRRNVRKHKEIKGSDKYFNLDIFLKFDSLENMEIICSESKGKLGRSGKGLITSLGFKAKARLQKYKKARYAIVNVSKKDLSKIIRDFKKFEKLHYEKKMPKHESTDSYFYISRQLAKCMMRADTLNWHDYGGYTEMTAPSSNVYSMDGDESKRSIVKKFYRTFLLRTRMNQNVSSCTILYCRVVLRRRVNQNVALSTKILPHNCFTDKDE